MIESATYIARRLQKQARESGLAKRCWAGWTIFLQYGPTVDAFDQETFRHSVATAEQIQGKKYDPDAARVAEKNQWHLSASWRGAYPVEDGRELLAELVVLLGVPEDKRNGFEFARVAGSPQVTHWMWKE